MLPRRDENQIAAGILRVALQRATKIGNARTRDYLAAWQKASSEMRNEPRKRERIAPRLPLPAMTPDELASIGRIDGITD